MAERRMFAKTIIDSDAFLDMPLSTQALYFHLSMRADDEGFINNPKKIQRMIGATDDDLKLLILKKFVLPFESGIVVIKHWKIHNYIQKDRFKPTVYQEEKNLLSEKPNKAYTLGVYSVDTECIQDVSSLETQVRLGKDSIDTKDNSSSSFTNNVLDDGSENLHGFYKNVYLTPEELNQLQTDLPDWQDRIEHLSDYMHTKGVCYMNHFATIRKWAREDKAKQQEQVTEQERVAGKYAQYDRY